MSSEVPQFADREPMQDMDELLAEADALERRVKRLPNGPTKARLRVAVEQIRTAFGAARPNQDRTRS
jgi:hypothetical protein